MNDDAANFSQLSIIIPAYNEEKGLAVTLKSLIAGCPGAEIIVIDDCSSDQTYNVAAHHKEIQVIRKRRNGGQGAALKTGMLAASKPYLAWFDADNEHRLEDLQRCYEVITKYSVVAAIGQRDGSSATFVRGLGKFVIRMLGRGLNINAGPDLNCGLRVFDREIIQPYMPLIPDRFSSSLVTTLIMVEQRYPIRFVPVKTNSRIGTSTVSVKDGLEAILHLFRCILLFAPMRFFFPLGLLLISIGSVYGIVMAVVIGQGLPLGGGLVIICGVLCIVIGLIVDQISQLRLSLLHFIKR